MDLEANLCAARLLMPVAWLQPRVGRGGAVDVLAVVFGVSPSRMRERIRAVRLMSVVTEEVES